VTTKLLDPMQCVSHLFYCSPIVAISYLSLTFALAMSFAWIFVASGAL
jgi:hypothetical protein